jgi:hypothetical protein
MIDVFAVAVTTLILAVPGGFAVGAYRQQMAKVRRWDQRIIYSAAEAGRGARTKARAGTVSSCDLITAITTVESVLKELEKGDVDPSAVDSQLSSVVDGFIDLAMGATTLRPESRHLAETLLARARLLEAVRTGRMPIKPGQRLIPAFRPAIPEDRPAAPGGTVPAQI